MDNNEYEDDGYETPEEEDNNSVDNNAPNTPNSLSDAFSSLGIKRNKSESDDNDAFDEELANIHDDMNEDEDMNQDEDDDIHKPKRYKQTNIEDEESDNEEVQYQNGGRKKGRGKRKNKTIQRKTKTTKTTKPTKKRNYKRTRKYNRRKNKVSVKKRTRK